MKQQLRETAHTAMLSVTSTTLSESPKQGISFGRGYSWLARSLTRSRKSMKWGDDAYGLRPLQRLTFRAVEGYAWARGRPGQSDIGVGEVEALYKPDVRLGINFRAPCLETQLHQSDGKRAYPARGIGDLCATREMEKLNPGAKPLSR